MKWLKYILLLIIIYLICSARTCTEDEEAAAKREEQSVIKLIESVENVFTSDTLSDDLLRAYEITAINKLNDFADYLKIISDTTLELKFRRHAAELARNLFVPGKIKLNNWGKAYPIHGLNTLELLLDSSLSEGIACWIQPLQVSVVNPYTRVNDSICTGALSFVPVYIPFDGKDQSVIANDKAEVDIYLMKGIKYFGDKQFRTWEVYLGNIE